jgi:spore maturation protein SpmA
MQLIPSATIISLRQAFDSAAPFDIIIPTLIATVIPLIFSVAAVKILQAKVKR